MTNSSAPPVLSADETRAAEALLAEAWGEYATVREATVIWNRRQVVRLELGADRSVVLKRLPEKPDSHAARSFGVELAALEYLNGMPVPVAPRLLGADGDGGTRLPGLRPARLDPRQGTFLVVAGDLRVNHGSFGRNKDSNRDGADSHLRPGLPAA